MRQTLVDEADISGWVTRTSVPWNACKILVNCTVTSLFLVVPCAFISLSCLINASWVNLTYISVMVISYVLHRWFADNASQIILTYISIMVTSNVRLVFFHLTSLCWWIHPCVLIRICMILLYWFYCTVAISLYLLARRSIGLMLAIPCFTFFIPDFSGRGRLFQDAVEFSWTQHTFPGWNTLLPDVTDFSQTQQTFPRRNRLFPDATDFSQTQ